MCVVTSLLHFLVRKAHNDKLLVKFHGFVNLKSHSSKMMAALTQYQLRKVTNDNFGECNSNKLPMFGYVKLYLYM